MEEEFNLCWISNATFDYKMILHKYLDKCYNTLSEFVLKVSRPTEFNDPFEFTFADPEVERDNKLYAMITDLKEMNFLKLQMGLPTKDNFEDDNKYIEFYKQYSAENYQTLIKNIKQEADKLVRIICFSSENSDDLKQILMWSHYTKGHYGLRFHFNSDLLLQKNKNGYIEKVRYSTQRPIIEVSIDPPQSIDNRQIINSFLSKSQAWDYEFEFRQFLPLTECFEKNNLIFFKFNPKSIIRIDIGVNCQMEDEVKRYLNRDELKHIKLYRAEIDSIEFKLNYKQIN